MKKIIKYGHYCPLQEEKAITHGFPQVSNSAKETFLGKQVNKNDSRHKKLVYLSWTMPLKSHDSGINGVQSERGFIHPCEECIIAAVEAISK